MKKAFILIIFFCVLGSIAYAQSFNVTEFANVGKTSLQDFQTYLGNTNEIRSNFSTGVVNRGAVLDTFFRITNEDDEDKVMIGYLIRNRLPTYGASIGDTYMVSVERRAVVGSYSDGWIVNFRHNGTNWSYYLFYYNIKVR